MPFVTESDRVPFNQFQRDHGKPEMDQHFWTSESHWFDFLLSLSEDVLPTSQDDSGKVDLKPCSCSCALPQSYWYDHHKLIGRVVGHNAFLRWNDDVIETRTCWARIDTILAEGFWATNIHSGERVYLPACSSTIHTIMPKSY